MLRNITEEMRDKNLDKILSQGDPEIEEYGEKIKIPQELVLQVSGSSNYFKVDFLNDFKEIYFELQDPNKIQEDLFKFKLNKSSNSNLERANEKYNQEFNKVKEKALKEFYLNKIIQNSRFPKIRIEKRVKRLIKKRKKEFREEIEKFHENNEIPYLNSQFNYINIEEASIEFLGKIAIPRIIPNSFKEYAHLKIKDKKGDFIQGYYSFDRESEQNIELIKNSDGLNKADVWFSPLYLPPIEYGYEHPGIRFYSFIEHAKTVIENVKNALEARVLINNIRFNSEEERENSVPSIPKFVQLLN